MKKFDINKNKFFDFVIKKFNNKFEYDTDSYIKMSEYIKIICPIHGKFIQLALSHKNSKFGCPKCAYENIGNCYRSNTEEFIKKAIKIHGDKYNYSFVNYRNNHESIKIECNEHGIFNQLPLNHLKGQRCPHCKGKNSSEKQRKSFENFVAMSKQIHGDRYDYSQVNYINNKTQVKIICPIHGEFMQIAGNHCRIGRGCPKCNLSKGELLICKILTKNNIEFMQQKTFDDFKNNTKIVSRNSYFDFYLEDYNIVIEYDGIQHFKPVKRFGGEKALIESKNRDIFKNEYCKNNNIKLLRIPYYEKNIEEIIVNFILLLSS